MAQKLGQDAPGTAYATQQIEQVGQSSQQAAEALLRGATQYREDLQRALPGAKRALYGQAAAGLAAGAAQAGRGGASAYGGALQGGMQAAQQAAGFDMTAAQQMANAAQMESQGAATQAAAAAKMLEFGTEEQRIATAKLSIEKQVQDAINAADAAATFGYDQKVLEDNLRALQEIYKNDPVLSAYLVQRANSAVSKYKEGFAYLMP